MSEKSTASAAKRLEARIGKVLSHHQNRGGFSTALSYTPDDPREQAHGSLYFVIDIGSPSPLSADIAYNLIDIVKDEFYADLELTAEKSFENALKSANEELEAIYKGGEKDWVGKLNAIIAAVHGNDIYIVQRGTAEVHLLRDTHMTNLSRGMYTPGETYRPEETLVNLLEGEIELEDKVLFSTSELFYYISIEKLKRLIEGHSPAAAAKKLATMLEQEEAINRTSVLVAEFNLPELIASEEDTEPAENWIGEPVVQKPRQAIIPAERLDKAQTVDEAISTTPEVETEEIENIASPASDVATNNYQEEGEAEEYEEVEQARTGIDIEAGLKRAGAGLASMSKNVNFGDYKGKLNIDSAKLAGASNVAGKVFKAIGLVVSAVFTSVAGGVGNFIRNTRRKPNGNKILLGVTLGLIAIIIAISVGVSASYSGRVGSRNAREALATATQKRDEAQAALIYEDTAKARVLLGEAYLAAETAAANPKFTTQANLIMADLQKQLDTVNGVKRFLDIQPLTDFAALNSQLGEGASAQVGKASVVGGAIYAVDSANNKIYRYKPESGEQAIVNSLVSSDKKLQLIAPYSPQEIIFSTTPPNVYSLNLANSSLVGKALDTGNWNNATKIVAYTNKLYFLDPSNNQIWKYQTAPEGFTPVAPYFENGSDVDLAGAIDFAINGSVYVLGTGNTLTKYSGGFPVDFKLQDVPAPYPAMGNITHIFADTDTKIYLLDEGNERVLVYNDDGTYAAQFIYGNIDGASNLYVDEAAGFIYMTTGTRVYRIPMK